jgi:hypothetical protein
MRLVTLATGGEVAIIFRLSPSCEQCVRRDTDVVNARCVVVIEEQRTRIRSAQPHVTCSTDNQMSKTLTSEDSSWYASPESTASLSLPTVFDESPTGLVRPPSIERKDGKLPMST